MGRFTILLLVASLSFVGVALSAGGGRSQNVTLCADKNGGEISLGAKGMCSKGEKKVTIAKQGPAGPEGDVGPPGEYGTTANLQPENPIVIGAGRSACQAAPGNYCGNPNCVGSWSGNARFQKDAMGFVHLSGRVGFATGGICGTDAPGIFFLPAGYRPADMARDFVVPKCTDGGDGSDVHRLTVETSGLVRIVSGTAACMSLDPVSFHP